MLRPVSPSPLRVAVLLSGGGRTLQNLLDRRAELDLEVVRVVSSRRDAYGLERAARAGIPTRVIRRRGHPGVEAFTAANFEACREAGAQLVCLAGYLKLLRPIPPDFQGRVLNVHPALLPAHGGEGCYGDRVHRAVLAAGEAETGCTVHLVDDIYDHGEPVVQRRVAVRPDDTVETLAARVFAEEREAYPEAIRRFRAGEVGAGPRPLE